MRSTIAAIFGYAGFVGSFIAADTPGQVVDIALTGAGVRLVATPAPLAPPTNAPSAQPTQPGDDIPVIDQPLSP